MEIKSKLTVTGGRVGGDNGEKRGKGCQGTCIKDIWTKPKGSRIMGGRWVLLSWGGNSGGKVEITVLENQQNKRKKDFIYLFLEKREGREKARGR